MLLVAVGLTVTGCQSELLTDVREQAANGHSAAIDFGNSFIDNPVNTRGVTRLAQHATSMGVWGWQSVDSCEYSLFNNERVYYVDSIDNWTYLDKRYWDSYSTYRFYAYSPYHTSVDGASVAINDSTGMFTINGVTLSGSNAVADGGARSQLGSFINADDTDWMIDRAGKTGINGSYGSRVMFNMQHILAKFNVLARSAGTVSTDENTIVTIDSIIIGTFKGQAGFVQRLDHTPNPDNALDNAVQEWTIDSLSSSYSLHSAGNVEIDAQGMYVIESLIIPQVTTPEQYIKVCFTMSSTGGRHERFVNMFAFDALFDRFVSGCNYTLILTISPDAIRFDTGCEQWIARVIDNNIY